MDNKVSQQINDIVGDNVKKIAQLFPSAVKDGEVDFEALKEELGEFRPLINAFLRKMAKFWCQQIKM